MVLVTSLFALGGAAVGAGTGKFLFKQERVLPMVMSTVVGTGVGIGVGLQVEKRVGSNAINLKDRKDRLNF